MRVIVFGGSFDPPHRGHKELLLAAINHLRPEKIVIVPAYQSPFKEAAQASSNDRLIMARLGILDSLPLRWRKICRVDAREARTRRQVFTFETLSALKGAERHFVCGQDSAASFPDWKNSSRLKSLAVWWYGVRPGAEVAPAHFRLLPGSFPSISSTQIRSKLALGQDCSKELLPAVQAHIDQYNLYGKNILSILKSTLPPLRYEHTLNVAALAEALASRYGADPAKARLAGLLHDAGRRYLPHLLAAYVKRRRLQVPGKAAIMKSDPLLLHAYVSEDLARREFGVSDPEILCAIRRHTLGDRRLSLLDKILYVADATALDRTHPGAAPARARAFVDLDAALKMCVAEKLIHNLRRGASIHPLTITLWNRLARL